MGRPAHAQAPSWRSRAPHGRRPARPGTAEWIRAELVSLGYSEVECRRLSEALVNLGQDIASVTRPSAGGASPLRAPAVGTVTMREPPTLLRVHTGNVLGDDGSWQPMMTARYRRRIC